MTGVLLHTTSTSIFSHLRRPESTRTAGAGRGVGETGGGERLLVFHKKLPGIEYFIIFRTLPFELKPISNLPPYIFYFQFNSIQLFIHSHHFDGEFGWGTVELWWIFYFSFLFFRTPDHIRERHLRSRRTRSRSEERPRLAGGVASQSSHEAVAASSGHRRREEERVSLFLLFQSVQNSLFSSLKKSCVEH